jgi:hypothetical protein
MNDVLKVLQFRFQYLSGDQNRNVTDFLSNMAFLKRVVSLEKILADINRLAKGNH